jgi:hypothetical protein
MDKGMKKPHIYMQHGCWWADWRGHRASGVTPARAYGFLPLRFIPLCSHPLDLRYNEKRHG